MLAIKPYIYISEDDTTDILACCPKCCSNIDWSYETTILGAKVKKWRHGKRKECQHCGQLIDWSEYRSDIIKRR